ncbi:MULTISPECIES: acyl-CoA dehydrogenase family protein [unclassified Paenibacillus]|uniref:acyl-CoA dehydrogenase family protein n=1 Tax=unclassified Paenibacillus TaxID=185978 RepID=UPI0006D21B4E|nr:MULTISPECIES: acyl-CoA dehydrogenase family protein [unclassified Paenibacillus]
MPANPSTMADESLLMKVPAWWNCMTGFEEMRDKARLVSEQVLRPNAEISDREGTYPRASLQALADAGFGAVTIPKEYGGLGAGCSGFAILAEIFAGYCASTTMVWVMHTAAVQTLFMAGSEEQRQRYIPHVVRGQIGGLAFSEPATGGHFWNVVSKAPRHGDGYLLNAHKSFVTSAGEADWYIVETNSPDSPLSDPLMFLIVENNQEGVVAFPFDALGLRGNNSGPMKFNDVFVPEHNRLGEEGGAGFYNDTVIDPFFLLGSSACWIGIAQGAISTAVDNAKKKIHADTGQSVANYQVIRHEMAKAQILVDSARSMLYRVAEKMDETTRKGELLSSCLYPLWELKTHAADIVIEVTNKALQISGGRGYLKGNIERFMRDGRAGAIMGPTNEVLREWIGRTMIGVPWL